MNEENSFHAFVKRMKTLFNNVKGKIKLIIVTNCELTKKDYLINQSMDAIVNLCNKYNIEFDFYLNENEFIESFFTTNQFSENQSKLTFIYNRSTGGPWAARRILIPAFCKYNSLEFLGNNAYLMGLLCNKFHYTSILKNIGVPVPETWCYDSNHGWLSEKPIEGIKVIIKLAYENNATSLNSNSVFIFTNSKIEAICHLSQKYGQPVIVQKFVEGYELTVPILISDKVYTPTVVGSSINGSKRFGKEIINSDLISNRIHDDRNSKYYDFASVNPTIVNAIKKDCSKIVKALGLKGFSRFDLRVDDSFGYYFNDLGSIPGILPESSFTYTYELHGYSYEDFLITTLCLELEKII